MSQLSIAGNQFYQEEEDLKSLINDHIFRRSDGSHQCTKCNYSSPHVCNVRRHVTLKHLEVYPFPCTLCSQSFKIEDFRIRHYQKAHNMILNSKDLKTMQAKMSGLHHK